MTPTPTAAPVLVLMGVSGCGKSTAAALLAGNLGWAYAEGDDLHPQANIDKMASGQPLTDEDRWPWLHLIADWISARGQAGEPGVVTCSALKRSYRDVLRAGGRNVVFVYLRGSHELIAERMTARQGHFMPAGLLDSQFTALEEPGPDERAVRVDVGGSAQQTNQAILAALTALDPGLAPYLTPRAAQPGAGSPGAIPAQTQAPAGTPAQTPASAGTHRLGTSA